MQNLESISFKEIAPAPEVLSLVINTLQAIFHPVFHPLPTKISYCLGGFIMRKRTVVISIATVTFLLYAHHDHDDTQRNWYSMLSILSLLSALRRPFMHQRHASLSTSSSGFCFCTSCIFLRLQFAFFIIKCSATAWVLDTYIVTPSRTHEMHEIWHY